MSRLSFLGEQMEASIAGGSTQSREYQGYAANCSAGL